MKSGHILLWSLSLCFSQYILASNAPVESWKVTFLKKYIENYKALSSVSHESVAGALDQSFNQAVTAAPSVDDHLVAAVRDQLAYFLNLQDANEKARELEKCKKGMTLAKSSWAKLAPDALKAHFFVEKFVAESAKRKKNQSNGAASLE